MFLVVLLPPPYEFQWFAPVLHTGPPSRLAWPSFRITTLGRSKKDSRGS